MKILDEKLASAKSDVEILADKNGYVFSEDLSSFPIIIKLSESQMSFTKQPNIIEFVFFGQYIYINQQQIG